MILNKETGWTESTIVINGHELSFAESMSVRVAVTSFLFQLDDPKMKKDLGAVASGYERCLCKVEQYMQDK